RAADAGQLPAHQVVLDHDRPPPGPGGAVLRSRRHRRHRDRGEDRPRRGGEDAAGADRPRAGAAHPRGRPAAGRARHDLQRGARMVNERPLRLGVVSYLNAVPLVHGLEGDPRFTLVRDMLAAAEAALVIGDPALYFRGDAERLDLGEEWASRTGLPFVFAFWAGRPGAVDEAGVARLQQALRAGQAAFSQIAAQYNGLGAGRGPESEAYLRRNIVYELGEPELRGLREFYRRAH